VIDGFGTGHSGFSYLQCFPIDIFKIDKPFLLYDDRVDDVAALALTIVNLAEAQQLHTVAEGIEELSQSTELARLGCTHGQGFLFARPADAASIAERLQQQAPNCALDLHLAIHADAGELVAR